MLMHGQWTLADGAASRWFSFDSSEWADLPRKPIPTMGRGLETIDNIEGWFSAIRCQGVVFTGDKYSVIDLRGRTIVSCWHDDLADRLPEERQCRVWTFFPPVQEERPYRGGVDLIWNTRQSQQIYAGARVLPALPHRDGVIAMQNTDIMPAWEDFIEPDPDFIRYGVWMPDELNAMHEEARRGGPTWMDHIPGGYTPPPFRQNTRSYLHNAPDNLDTDCSNPATNNNKMALSGQTNETLTANVAASSDRLTHSFTTETDEPNVADWPVASVGDPYRTSINATSVGSEVSFGWLVFGGTTGEWQRINSGCTRQEGWGMEEVAFTGTGVKVGNNTTINPASGAASDRLQSRLAAQRVGPLHGNQDLHIDTDSNSFSQGPWAAAGGGERVPRPVVVAQAVQRASVY